MDIKKVVSFEDENIWKSDHTSNPYAIVLNAKKIWRFTKSEWPEKYKFYFNLIKENEKEFKWGLSKQKTIKIFVLKEHYYFAAPPDIIYRVIRKEPDKKKGKKRG